MQGLVRRRFDALSVNRGLGMKVLDCGSGSAGLGCYRVSREVESSVEEEDEEAGADYIGPRGGYVENCG